MRKTVLSLVLSALCLLGSLLPQARSQGPAPAPAPAPAPKPAPPAPCPCDNCKDCTIEAPESLSVVVGRDTVLAIKCEKRVSFIGLDEDDDVTVVPSFVENTFVVKAYAVGTYRLIAVVACKGEVKHVKIAVEAKEKAPKPPKPGPGPGPQPGPAPAPADPLTKDLQSAFALEQGPAKAAHAASLASVYRTGVPKVKDFATGAALLADLKAVSKAMEVPDDAIPLVRGRIAVELKKALVAGELTDAQKATIKALFEKLAEALAGLK